MIEHQYGRVMIVCDDCGDVHPGDSTDFNEALTAAKDDGWTITKEGDTFKHWCHAPCDPL